MRTTSPIRIFIIVVVMILFSFLNKALGQNLIINPGFTNGTTGWSTNCSIEIYTENVYGGVNSSNNVSEIDIERCFNQEVAVNAGGTYAFGYKASRRQSGTPATVGVNVTVTGVQSGTQYINAFRTYTNTTWAYTNEAFSFTLPIEAIDTRVNVKFSNYITSGTYGTIIDDIYLNGGSSAILPIKFIGFSGKMKNNSALINWSASNDDNEGKYFIIERSVNQGSYDSIGIVKVSGTGTAYSFVDNNLSNGSNFYRIKAVNANGVYSYSNVISLESNKTSAIRIYPNPATSNIGLTFTSDSKISANLYIYNLSGNLITTKQTMLNEGSNAVSMDITSLKPGSYFLKVSDNKGLNFSQSFCKK